MRMRTFAALAVAWPWCIQAQPTFEKLYLAGGYGHLIELSSHNVLTGFSYSSSSNVTGTALMGPDGSILHSNCRAIDTMLVQIGLKRYSDNEFYFTSAYFKDSCVVGGNSGIQKIYPVIGRLDSLGNILSARYYTANTSSCANMVGDLEVVGGKSVITWGNSFALKVDSTGQPVWSKLISDNARFRFIRELPGGDLLAGINVDSTGAVLARLDSGGNFLWSRSYIRPKGIVHDVLIESDDSFIITGYTDSTDLNMFVPLPGSFHPKLFIMKLNGAGEVQWCRGYDSAPPLWHTPIGTRIVKAHDGNYTILATLGYPEYNRFFRPFLMKTDQDGDTLWTRSAGYAGYDQSATNLLAYSDGGYLFSGSIWGNLPNGWSGAPYAFKTNASGHLPCAEEVHTVQVLDLFPADSSVTLTSLDGGAVALPAFVQDVDDFPIAQYDGCTLYSGIEVIHVQPFRIRPNPNTGQFTVEFANPLMAESYYSVYDALGKLLYHRPLPAGATVEEIDLSRFGRGTYVLKLTDPQGSRYERVVLE